MSKSAGPPNSLGDERTRAGSLDEVPRAPASLGDEDTAGDRPSTHSDLGDFEQGWQETEEAVDFEARYEVQDAIGQGGMGMVVRARDRRLERMVAIKRLKQGAVESRTAVQRFLSEARAIARLNHFNIVQVHDVGRDKLGHYIVMELVDGEKPLSGDLPAGSHGSVTSGGHRRPGLQRALRRTFGGDHPSRHQAREHPADGNRDSQAGRLWPCPLGIQ